VISNSSWIVEVPDHVADFMLQDGRSGCVLVEDSKGKGPIITSPCCHFAWREQQKEEKDPAAAFDAEEARQ
jgi:hypothetical protein